MVSYEPNIPLKHSEVLHNDACCEQERKYGSNKYQMCIEWCVVCGTCIVKSKGELSFYRSLGSYGMYYAITE